MCFRFVLSCGFELMAIYAVFECIFMLFSLSEYINKRVKLANLCPIPEWASVVQFHRWSIGR